MSAGYGYDVCVSVRCVCVCVHTVFAYVNVRICVCSSLAETVVLILGRVGVPCSPPLPDTKIHVTPLSFLSHCVPGRSLAVFFRFHFGDRISLPTSREYVL